MKNFAVIQHNYSEFLGLIEHQLEVRDIGFSYFRPFVDQALPASPLPFDALFVLGGDWPVEGNHEQAQRFASEKALIANFLNAKRPVIGIGLGGQLVAEYAGARSQEKELHKAYWTTAHVTELGKEDALAKAVDGKRVMVLHRGKTELPDELAPIVVDDEGQWLAIRAHHLAYGMLFRPELKPGMLEDMIMEAGRVVPDNISELLSEARNEWAATQKNTDQITIALVSTLDLMKERRKPPVIRLNVEPE